MLNFKRINWEKVSWVIAIELAVAMVILAFFLPGGQDTRFFYQPFAAGCLDCGFVPYYVQPLLAPLQLGTWDTVWPLWTAISLTGLLWVAKRTEINPLIFLLTFPMIGQYWLGQIDVLLCIGALLAIREKNPYLRGLGILLLLVKPQIAFLAVLFLLIREDRKQLVKVLAVPAGVFALSLLVYGWDWPLDWIGNVTMTIPDHIWKEASVILWPYALVLLPVPLLFREREEGTVVSLLVSSLAMPYFSVYSYIVFLIFESPWWVLPLSYAYKLFQPWLGLETMRMAWLLPGGMLIWHLARRFGLRKTKQ